MKNKIATLLYFATLSSMLNAEIPTVEGTLPEIEHFVQRYQMGYTVDSEAQIVHVGDMNDNPAYPVFIEIQPMTVCGNPNQCSQAIRWQAKGRFRDYRKVQRFFQKEFHNVRFTFNSDATKVYNLLGYSNTLDGRSDDAFPMMDHIAVSTEHLQEVSKKDFEQDSQIKIEETDIKRKVFGTIQLGPGGSHSLWSRYTQGNSRVYKSYIDTTILERHTIGYIGKDPVVVDLKYSVINEKIFLLWEICSFVGDVKMAQNFVKQITPGDAVHYTLESLDTHEDVLANRVAYSTFIPSIEAYLLPPINE